MLIAWKWDLGTTICYKKRIKKTLLTAVTTDSLVPSCTHQHWDRNTQIENHWYHIPITPIFPSVCCIPSQSKLPERRNDLIAAHPHSSAPLQYRTWFYGKLGKDTHHHCTMATQSDEAYHTRQHIDQTVSCTPYCSPMAGALLKSTNRLSDASIFYSKNQIPNP